jgi:ubiquinone biosynthesis protein
MEEWMWNRIGPSAQLARLRSQAPALAESLPELAQRALKVLAQGPSQNGLNAENVDALRGEIRNANRRTVFAAGGGATWLAAAVLYGLAAHSPAPLSVVAVCGLLALAGAFCWRRALRRED